ncbi:hypothetical protein TELCIR_06424 [Teladorsagia circumcincta]|uniref:Uncharacterized protein n=1 Tax=Teladorsagia circumcincta TaxID=45464 RepID=A0A2G9UN87_TELCI|nr:hypothetical protein TELCIR_06424 [Teladorsagia circumcincta]
MSNILGMYGQKNNISIADQDYPSVEGWPEGFVPVAIHTVDDDTDYVLNPGADCDRQIKLWEMAKNSSEIKSFVNRNDTPLTLIKEHVHGEMRAIVVIPVGTDEEHSEVASLLANLTVYCGHDVHMDNLWVIRDALLVEQIHANKTLREVNNWFSDDLFNHMTAVNHQVEAYQNGIFNDTLIMNNLDIGNELQKIRGGSMVNDINMHMNIKLECQNKSSNGCKWINGLKYYVYSALRYHQNEANVTLYPITHLVDSCKGRQYCSLDVFRMFANRTKPDLPMSEQSRIRSKKGFTDLATFKHVDANFSGAKLILALESRQSTLRQGHLHA